MNFIKQKHETIFYRNYKKFDNLKFKEALDGELMKHEVNNITFHEIMLSILNVHAPIKNKHLRPNYTTFVTKESRKAVMKRARLRNAFLKIRTEATKAAYSDQLNVCVSRLRKSKGFYFENLDVRHVKDNNYVWKKFALLFSNKVKLRRESHLLKMKTSFQMIKKLLDLEQVRY